MDDFVGPDFRAVRPGARMVHFGPDITAEYQPRVVVGLETQRILPVEPSSLLYMIWASTQHYADFDHQVNILNDHQPLSDIQFERAVQTVTSVILRGIGLEP